MPKIIIFSKTSLNLPLFIYSQHTSSASQLDDHRFAVCCTCHYLCWQPTRITDIFQAYSEVKQLMAVAGFTHTSWTVAFQIHTGDHPSFFFQKLGLAESIIFNFHNFIPCFMQSPQTFPHCKYKKMKRCTLKNAHPHRQEICGRDIDKTMSEPMQPFTFWHPQKTNIILDQASRLKFKESPENGYY